RSAADETVLGEALHMLQRHHEANEAFQRAIKRDANYVPALVRRAELFAEKQDYPYAVELFKQALKIRPDHIEAMVGLAGAMPDAAAGESEELVKKALGLNPHYIDAHQFEARRAIQSDLPDEARKSLDAALAV